MKSRGGEGYVTGIVMMKFLIFLSWQHVHILKNAQNIEVLSTVRKHFIKKTCER